MSGYLQETATTSGFRGHAHNLSIIRGLMPQRKLVFSVGCPEPEWEGEGEAATSHRPLERLRFAESRDF